MPALRIDRERFSYVPSARKTAVRSTEHSVTVDCEDQDGHELEVTDLAVCSSLGTQRMTLVLMPVHGHRCRRHDIPSHELSTIVVSHAHRQGTSVYMHPFSFTNHRMHMSFQRVTAHQWAVYDFVRKIPCGMVTTYKHLCLGIGEGSPRSGTYPHHDASP
jgi:6-O-methylguanine DNA methyltransferase, DNA binding domain